MEDQEAWQERVARSGRHPTPVIDRFWFRSVYFREPSGVLFELATLGPGFATDEDPAHLGERLVLPPAFEHLRERVEQVLTPAAGPARRARGRDAGLARPGALRRAGRARARARGGRRRIPWRGGRSAASARSTTAATPRRNSSSSKRRALATQACGSTASASKRSHGLDERAGLGAGEERAGHAFEDRVADAALVERDHRPPGGLGLDGGDAELLLGRHHERAAPAAALRPRVGVGHAAREADRGPGQALEAARVGPVADDHERQPQAVEGLDGDVEVLVGHELAEHDVASPTSTSRRREARRLHRRVQDVGVAAEVAR